MSYASGGSSQTDTGLPVHDYQPLRLRNCGYLKSITASCAHFPIYAAFENYPRKEVQKVQ